MTILIVAPTYMEALNVEAFLSSTHDAVPGVHILIVDDSSPDGTSEIAESFAEHSELIHVLRRSGQRGLADAYRQGFKIALDRQSEIIISMDVDGSHDPTAIPRMLQAIHDGADVVIGSRYVDGGATINWPTWRRWLSSLGNRYAALVLRLEFKDCTSGFRAYRCEALRSLDTSSTTADGYAFLTELAVRMKDHKLNVVEVPITFRDRVFGQSKMSWRIIIESAVLVNRLGLRRVLRQRNTSGRP